MKNIFLDTNVVIDFLSDRQPFSIHAARLFELGINGNLKIYISAVSYNNIYYVLRQSLAHTTVLKLIMELSEFTKIIDVTGAVIKQSFQSEFKDYEDAIQYYCALTIPAIEFIITRNTKDFKKSTLPVLTPSEVLALISEN